MSEICDTVASSGYPKISDTAAALADFLRSSPARSILDRQCASICETTGLPTTCLMLRTEGRIETIATHGVWLMSYSKSATTTYSPRLNKKFSFETENIQNDPRFVNSSFVKENRHWKYGAMRMIEHEFSREFDIELWCSDINCHPENGIILDKMRVSSNNISDTLSLIIQIWRNQQNNIAQDNIRIKSILEYGIMQSSFCAALIDENLNIISASPAMARFQSQLCGPQFVKGQHLTDFWLDGRSSLLVNATMQSGVPTLGQRSRLSGLDRTVEFDFMSSTFSGGSSRFGLLTLRQEMFGSAEMRPDLIMLNDVSRDIPIDGPQPVSQFLLSTLLRNTRLSRRKAQAYICTRTWRKTIKDHQIAALKALKSEPPAHLVETVANELAEAIRTVYGTGVARYVVPVPCGHSCSECFSVLVAQAVAEKLNLEFVEAFERQSLRGSSHPKNNVRRPRMKVQRAVTGPTILIDDVATSGSHIEEASRLLHMTTDTVWPIVWIAD